MFVVNTFPVPKETLIDYAVDESSLRITVMNNDIELYTVDPDTMAIISKFHVRAPYVPENKPAIDHSCIFLPTSLGQILAIDKFSGELLTTIDVGDVHILSSVQQDDTSIFCIASIPTNSRASLSSDKYSIFKCDKMSGKKTVQTNYFFSRNFHLTIEDNIWLLFGNSLIKYDKNGQQDGTTALSSFCDFPPVITSDHVICTSKKGFIEIFSKSQITKSITRDLYTCSTPPIADGTFLYWAHDRGLTIADMEMKTLRTIETDRQIFSPIKIEDRIYACGLNGFIHEFDLTSNTTNRIKLNQHELIKPVAINGFVFVSTAKLFFQISI